MIRQRVVRSALAPVALVGAGRLYWRDRLVCEVAYHLVGWPDDSEPTHVAGVLRRLDGGTFDDVLGQPGLSVNLEGDVWWNCRMVHRDGWTTSRGMGVHRRPLPDAELC